MHTRKICKLFSAAVLAVGLTGSTVEAQKRAVTVEYILSTFKPQHADIEIETPEAKLWPKCKVDVIDEAGSKGYLVLGPAGQTLRKFLDTNGDDKTDQWGYYQGGIEVYREIDTNSNNKVDQVRWLNLGGMRWGIDKDEDGKIDEWKMISAEEVSRVVVRALVTQDPDLLTPLLVSKDDLKSLGIKGNLETRLLASVENAPAKLQKAVKGSKVLTPRTIWRRFDSAGPGAVPADTHNTKDDLIVAENALAFVDYGDAKQQGLIVLGELLKVGSTWKLTGIPAPADPDGNIELPSGIVMFESVRGATSTVADGAPAAGVSEKMAELFKQLRELQDNPPAETASKAEWEKYSKALDRVLVLLFNESTTDADREQWVRQLLDAINALVQADHYPQGLERLRKLEKDIEGAFKKLAPFAEYRRTWAEFTVAMRETKDDDDRGKIHAKWLKDLEAFVEKHSKADDASEAALQLAFEYEYGGKIDKARAWYQKVIQSYGKTTAADRARGAMRRLELPGKILAVSGKSLNGSAVDVKQFRGKTLLVVFWDTNSKPAAEDLPALKELYDQYGGKGFEILGVNLDPEREMASGYVAQRNVRWPQIHEPGGLQSAPALEFGIISLPTMFLVDPEGKVISRNASVEEVKTALAGEKSK